MAFPRVSIDLIYALPGQTAAGWAAALCEAVAIGAEHISPYQLTIEPRTAFDRAVRRGAWAPPEPERAADLYEATQRRPGGRGLRGLRGLQSRARSEAARSRHNLIYWRGQDYVGVGPGAHGRLTLAEGRFATEAPRAIADYVARVRQAERARRSKR